jgi:sugar-specific transcriptional regulator TrmB
MNEEKIVADQELMEQIEDLQKQLTALKSKLRKVERKPKWPVYIDGKEEFHQKTIDGISTAIRVELLNGTHLARLDETEYNIYSNAFEVLVCDLKRLKQITLPGIPEGMKKAMERRGML